jgi:hypothetical protein
MSHGPFVSVTHQERYGPLPTWHNKPYLIAWHMHAPRTKQDFLRMKIKGNNNGMQYCGNNFLSDKGKKKLVARLIWQSWSDKESDRSIIQSLRSSLNIIIIIPLNYKLLERYWPANYTLTLQLNQAKTKRSWSYTLNLRSQDNRTLIISSPLSSFVANNG